MRLNVCTRLCLSSEWLGCSLKVCLVPTRCLIVLSFLSLFHVFFSARRAASRRLTFVESLIRFVPLTDSMGCQNTDCTTLGKAFYFPFSGVAPSQRQRDILSARCLRMNSFSCQTITQTLSVCGLSIYLFYFFSSHFKASVSEVTPAVFAILFQYQKMCILEQSVRQ